MILIFAFVRAQFLSFRLPHSHLPLMVPVCLCFEQRSHSHVWDHEKLRPHLWEALVAWPLQNSLPHLWQHETPRTADGGQWSKNYLFLSRNAGSNTMLTCVNVLSASRSLSGWRQRVTTRYTPSVTCSPSSTSLSVRSCWLTFSHSCSGVSDKVGAYHHYSSRSSVHINSSDCIIKIEQ